MNYCIQCTDKTTGKVGSFGIDPEEKNRPGYEKGKFTPISPFFPDLYYFFKWARENRVELNHFKKASEAST